MYTRMVFADHEYQEMIFSLKQDLPSVEQYYSLTGGKGTFSDFRTLLEILWKS